MKHLLLFIAVFSLQFSFAQYTVGTRNITWTDPARSNRSVTLEFRYPGTNTAVANGQFPFVIFAHGFQMDQVPYYPYSDSLAKQGYIVGLLTTETGLAPSHPNFAQDLIFTYNKLISESNTNSASPFYQKVVPKGALGGHSMGGGSTVLSAQYSTPATCYFTFAAATTNPSSITAAPQLNKPYLAFAGSLDCIAPPATNQRPMYDSANSPCKFFVNITNGRHCAFGNSNFQCNFGEGFSGCASSPLSTAAQINKSLSFLVPYLDYYLKGDCSAWTLFESRYNSNTVDVLARSCTNNIPANPSITGATEFCSGSSTTLTAQPAGFGYTWSDNTTAGTLAVTQAGNYSVTVGNGTCSLAPVSTTVTQLPVPSTPSAISAPDTVCSGIATINLSVDNDPGVFYNWQLPAGWNITQGDSTNIVTVTSGNNGGTVSVTAENLCGVTSAVTKTITVVPSNLGTAGNITGTDSVCAGTVLTYSIQAVNGAASYMWSLPAGWNFTTPADSTTIEVTAGSSSGDVSVMAMNSCGASPSSTLAVVANSAPVLTGSIIGEDTLCVGNTQGIYYAISPLVLGNYVWTLPGGWSFLSGDSTATPILNVGSTGTISVKAENECGQSQALTYNIAVVDTPTPIITPLSAGLQSSPAASYQWYQKNQPIQGATGQVYNTAVIDTYWVEVTNANGCIGRTAPALYIFESIGEVDDNSLGIYPNPASTQLFITTPFAGTLNVQLFTAEGKLVQQQQLTDAGQAVDVSRLSKGLYVLQVEVQGKTLRKKVAVW